MSRLVALHVGGQCEPWLNVGLSFTGTIGMLGDVELSVQEGAPGLIGWTIETDSDAFTDIDGIPTTLVSTSTRPAISSPIGEQRIVRLDHVVVNTDDIDRTSHVIESVLGLPARRDRDAGNGVSQRFHVLDNTIIEVVSGPHITSVGASLWGMVVSVDDLFELTESLGPDVTSPPKRATQPGRYISTVRSATGLGVPFALMTPHIK